MEVSESNFCLQLHFEWYASGPPSSERFSSKPFPEILQLFNVVFSSDRSDDRFTRKLVAQTTGLLDVKRGMEGSGFHSTGILAGKHVSVIGAL